MDQFDLRLVLLFGSMALQHLGRRSFLNGRRNSRPHNKKWSSKLNERNLKTPSKPEPLKRYYLDINN